MNSTIISYAIIEIYEKWIMYSKEDNNSFLCEQYSKLRTYILDGLIDTNPQEFMMHVNQIFTYENIIMEHKEAMNKEKQEKQASECDDYFIPHEDDERSNSDLVEEIADFDPDAVNHWVNLLVA